MKTIYYTYRIEYYSTQLKSWIEFNTDDDPNYISRCTSLKWAKSYVAAQRRTDKRILGVNKPIRYRIIRSLNIDLVLE